MVGGTVDPEGAGRLLPLMGRDKNPEEYSTSWGPGRAVRRGTVETPTIRVLNIEVITTKEDQNRLVRGRYPTAELSHRNNGNITSTSAARVSGNLLLWTCDVVNGRWTVKDL